MKIALYCRHQGLDRVMRDIWQEHTVLPLLDYMAGELPVPKADVYVSTIPHWEAPEIAKRAKKWKKPIIFYLTNPIPDEFQTAFEEMQTYPWYHTIGCEPCYPAEVVRPWEECIPFAIDGSKYEPYTGAYNKIGIINRKAVDRWHDCQAQENQTPLPLEEYLEGLPWEIVSGPNVTVSQIRTAFGRYKVLLQYNTALYSIVMFEAMTVGTPMVGFNNKFFKEGVERYPIEHYLPIHSTDRDFIRQKLQEILDAPPERVFYEHVPSIGYIQRRWNDLFRRVGALP